MRYKRFVPAVMIGSILSSPVAAADPNLLLPDHHQRDRAAGYVGATISLTRNARREAAPAFRLGIGVRHRATSAAGLSARNSLVKLDPAAAKGPELYVGGNRLTAADGGGGMGAGAILLTVAAVAGAIFLVTQVADSDDGDEEQCMIEPELCQ